MNPARLIIVHWNRPLQCAATIAAFREQAADLSILVLDNHSATGALEELRAALNDPVEIVRLPQNKGWGPALNIALRRWLKEEASAYCVISAHDAIPAPGCVTRLLDVMKGDGKIGIACPEYPDGSVARLSPLRGVAQEFAPRLRDGEVCEIDVPHGTLMIVRRECLLEIGLFDERYFAYGDEHELGARARRRGWKIALAGGAVVENPQTSTASEMRSYLFTRNSLLLVHDYFGRFAAWSRAVLLVCNTIRLLARPRADEFAFSPRARWRGLRDYFAGRFGAPPAG